MRNLKMRQSKNARIIGTMLLGAAAAVSLVLASGALRPGSTTAAQDESAANSVTIDNFSFTRMELDVAAGTEVTWTNKDDVPHTVVSVDGKFKSRALDTDQTFSFTFKDPGTYEYFCSVHPRMTGKIVVK